MLNLPAKTLPAPSLGYFCVNGNSKSFGLTIEIIHIRWTISTLIILPVDYNDSDYDGEDSENDYNADHASLMKSQVKCPVCNTITKCKKKSNGTFEGITRNVTIESITEDYR